MKPLKLAMYYGYPSLINKLVDYNDIIDEYSKYDIMIWGGFYNDSNLKDIINSLVRRYTFSIGYVNMKLHKNEIKHIIQKWNDLGVYGIFLDNCGYDCSVSRSKQNNIIEYVHNLSLITFVKSTNPNDVIEDYLNIRYNPFGIDTV